MYKLSLQLIILLAASFGLCDESRCLAEPVGELLVTKGFSQELSAVKHKWNDSNTLLSQMRGLIEFSTGLGGSFVTQISGEPRDADSDSYWFLYRNGILSQTGAGDLVPRARDRIWWSYHSWNSSRFIPAVIGSWPEPFVSGIRSDSASYGIVTSSSFIGFSRDLSQMLVREGASKPTLQEISSLDEVPEHGISLWIGLWPDLKNINHLAALYSNGDKTGCFVQLDKEGSVGLLNYNGQLVKEIVDAGLIISLSSNMGQRIDWVISGTSEDALLRAANLLLQKGTSLAQKAGVVVTKEEVINVPVL